MANRKEPAKYRIPWPITAAPLLFLCVLYASGLLVGWQKYRPIIGNAIATRPNTQITEILDPTETSPPTSTQPPQPSTLTYTSTNSPLLVRNIATSTNVENLPTDILILTNTPLTPTNTLILSTNTLSLTPTSSQPELTLSATPPGQNVITLTGTTNVPYSPKISDNTLIDATSWTSTAIGPAPHGTTSKAVDIYGTDNSAGGADIIWRGGVIVGSIPQSWDWRTTHEFGGSGIYLRNDGPVEWQFVRIHNVEDGVEPRETPEYSNSGSWLLRDSYFTAIRDDAIENDRFEPGTVQDCLFDGVFAFLSEQDENVGSNTPVGPNENNVINVSRVYVRLYGTNASDGPGKWFKWQGNVQHHKLVVSDSVFAIGSEPLSGWSRKIIPPEVTWEGNNNFILWLGAPGAYGGPKPEGVTFLEGEAAHHKWISVRNQWLTDHGLPPQNFSADYNPHDAPIMQIPIKF